MQKVFVVILNFNGLKNTIECLESLRKIEKEDFDLHVVVVDNNSKEQFNLNKKDFESLNLVIIKNKENLGFAGGNNVGIHYAIENGVDYVLILNNDTIVDKSLVEELLNAAQKDKDIGIVSPKIYFAPGFEFHKDRYKKEEQGRVFWYAGGEMDFKNIIGHHRGVDEIDNGQYDKIEETDFATGCCMLVRKDIFKELGMFDEKYFLYYEDADLSERVKKTGCKIMYAAKAVIWHKNAGSTGGSGSKLQDYYITRNRLLFGFRYASFRSKLSLLKESLRLLISGRTWQRRGVLDFYLGKLGKGSFKV